MNLFYKVSKSKNKKKHIIFFVCLFEGVGRVEREGGGGGVSKSYFTKNPNLK